MGVAVMNVSCLMLVMMRLALTPPGDDLCATDPFARAAIAPSSLTLYVHIENAAELRGELADRPIARWFQAVADKGDVHKAWTSLAAAAHMDEARLFDECLGRNCTLMVREQGEWALIAQAKEERVSRLLQHLKPRVLEPRHGMALAELPEQDVFVARNRQIMIIGPTGQPALFYELLPQIDRSSKIKTAALEAPDNPALRLARELGPGQIGIIIRHDPPMGGFSAVVGQFQGDQLTIKHAAKFDNAPFQHGVTKLQCDFSPVMNFEHRALVAFMQPTDIHDGPLESFLAANLNEGLLSGPMRDNLGDRRLIVIDEVEGRNLERPVDLLNTTFVACLQVKRSEPSIRQLDEQMVKITGKINAFGKGAYLVKTPHVRSMKCDEPREVDLAAAGEWFAGGFPIMQNIALTWTVAEGPQGAWYVIGSNRQSLDEVANVLRKAPVSAQKIVGKFDSCGIGNGIRLGRHLRSWSDRAAEFADPQRVDELRSTLHLMSELAGGMQNCRWQLERPTDNEMRLNVQVKLAPPESSRAE
jgi:hypothetical protein